MRRIGEGSQPAVSPRADTVAFVRQGRIWIASLRDTFAPTPILRLRGSTGSLRWSPDGRRLAFVSGRTRHSFVGVFDLRSRSLVWLDPGIGRDRDPVWAPEGKAVAFLRLPAEREHFQYRLEREGLPWSIRIADPETGRGSEVWRAASGRGSVFRALSQSAQLLWAEGDRLVFPWERDGWIHLYTVVARGVRNAEAHDAARLLTPGPFEVERATLTADRREVVYSSNQDDPDRRHLWRVAVGGGAAVALTRGGIEWSPVAIPGRDAIAFLHSDERRPARPALIGPGAARDLAPEAMPPDFPSTELVEPEPVVFRAEDGMAIHAQLFRPPSEASAWASSESARDAGSAHARRRPAVIFLHGGSQRQMLLGWHPSFYYSSAYGLNQLLANRGFVVLSVNFRSGIGYGLEFRESPGYGPMGASELQDVIAAARYLRTRRDVDGRRIGLWGGSWGGYLTALALARAPDLFAAGVEFHGVHDWNAVFEADDPDYEPQHFPKESRLAAASSPLFSVANWRAPVLLIHGDEDSDVAFTESIDLAAALREKGVHVEELVLPDEEHSFLLHRNWLRAYEATADFFSRHLVR